MKKKEGEHRLSWMWKGQASPSYQSKGKTKVNEEILPPPSNDHSERQNGPASMFRKFAFNRDKPLPSPPVDVGMPREVVASHGVDFRSDEPARVALPPPTRAAQEPEQPSAYQQDRPHASSSDGFDSARMSAKALDGDAGAEEKLLGSSVVSPDVPPPLHIHTAGVLDRSGRQLPPGAQAPAVLHDPVSPTIGSDNVLAAFPGPPSGPPLPPPHSTTLARPSQFQSLSERGGMVPDSMEEEHHEDEPVRERNTGDTPTEHTESLYPSSPAVPSPARSISRPKGPRSPVTPTIGDPSGSPSDEVGMTS